jgi:hypothetical protein
MLSSKVLNLSVPCTNGPKHATCAPGADVGIATVDISGMDLQMRTRMRAGHRCIASTMHARRLRIFTCAPRSHIGARPPVFARVQQPRPVFMCTYACLRSSTRTYVYGSRVPQTRSRLYVFALLFSVRLSGGGSSGFVRLSGGRRHAAPPASTEHGQGFYKVLDYAALPTSRSQLA